MTVRRIHSFLLALVAFCPASHAFLSDPDTPYELTTDVTQALNLSLDIKDMRAEVVDLALEESIYSTGKNALPLTLQQLSLDAINEWPLSPMYNIYRHAFTQIGASKEHDNFGDFDGKPAVDYANTLVEDLFSLQIDRIEAEGALIFNVLMAFWSELNALRLSCWSVVSAEKTSAEENPRMIKFLDTAIALWVGAEQNRGESSSGYMLYNLAQAAGERFDQGQTGGEVEINELMISLFVGIKRKIERNACEDGDEYAVIRQEIKAIIQYSNAVLVQMLLRRLEENGPNKADFVEMYSLAIIPQVATCDDGLYQTLMRDAIGSSITDDTEPGVIEALQGAYHCLLLTCDRVGEYLGGRIPKCDDSALPSLQDYQPKNDVRLKSYIDLDLRQMRVFMGLGAFENAEDFFIFGWNSDTSLADISEEAENDEVALYVDYTDDKYFPESIALSALNKLQPFDTATNEEITQIVMSSLQSTVMYWAVVEELFQSNKACKIGDITSAEKRWDNAAAYFIGSAEAKEASHQEGGELMFSVAKDLCVHFGTCEPSSSEAARAFISALKAGQSAIQEGSCETLETLLTDQLYAALRIPLIQGTIFYASQKEATALTYARAILPAVNETSPTSAEAIQVNTDFYFTSALVPDFPVLVKAFQDALNVMTTNCGDIGELAAGSASYGFCVGDPIPTDAIAAPTTPPTTPPLVNTDAPVSAPPVTTSPTTSPIAQLTANPTIGSNANSNGLAWGAYTFSDASVAENDSKFSLDVKQMYQAGSPVDASNIYTQPSSNVPAGLTGLSSVQSLKDFSTQASSFMDQDPVYNFYRVALYDDESFDDVANADGWPFSHSVVELALGPENGNDQILGAKAVVVMNVWMLITNRLYEATRQCAEGNKPLKLVDSAVALWIGQEQERSKFDSGWMVYSLAQEAAQLYGNPEGEATVNRNLLTLFVTAQERAGLCEAGSDDAYVRFRITANEIVRQLSIPLLQNLLYYMSVDEFEDVELLSLAFLPQAVACNEGTYGTLRDTLYEGFERDQVIDSPEFLSKMGEFLVCLEIKCGELGDVSNANENLKKLVNSLCGHLNSAGSPQIGGYVPTAGGELSKVERIDLDIHQMDLFMRVRAYEAAAEIYEFGRNAVVDEEKWVSLATLTADLELSGAAEFFTIYSEYFKSDFFAADDIIAAMTSGQGSRFDGASRRQLSEVTFRSSQGMLSFLLVLGQLRDAVQQCEASGGGQDSVDQAVALYVGSMEGRPAGGDVTKNGKLLFALAKEVCESFDRCGSHGNAKSNEVIMTTFTELKKKIDSNDCSSVELLVDDTILPRIMVSLIQGTLVFARTNAALPAQSDNETLVSGDILSKAILPLVDAIDESSAAVISENMEFSRSTQPVKSGAAAVFDAFAAVLEDLGVDCSEIGSLGTLSTCPVTNTVEPDTPTNLGDDLYVTTTYVQDRADIALDVKQMQMDLTNGNKDQALLIYQEGEHSEVFDNLGRLEYLRSLAGFSTGATTSNPLYTIAVYALRDNAGKYRGENAWYYADTIVKATIDSAPAGSTLGADAAVSLNLWMEIVNELFNTVDKCKVGDVKDSDGVKSIDEAVAYWIGDGQIGGDPKRGHLLYALAERMGENFYSLTDPSQTLNQSGQSRANVNILRLFHQAKIELSVPEACAEKAASHRVQHVVNKIVTQMIIVNAQALIHYLREENRDAVRVYAHAVVPLVASCSPSAFSYLREKLLDNSVFPASEVEDIIQRVYSTFPCFGIQCEDIGKHKLETVSTCKDPSARPALASYTPSSAVDEFSQLDLDILELGILMDMEAYDAAEDLYTFGKHTPTADGVGRTSLSLESMAKKTSQSTVAEIEIFKHYFGNDASYADTLVRSTFTDTNGYSPVQRRVIATGVCRYMVMFAAVLEEINRAVNSCKAGNPSSLNDAMESWDRAGAFAIGHLEGTSDSGTNEGLLFWGLAKQTCSEFGTCSSEVTGSSLLNDRITALLYAGRGAILGSNCGELKKASRELTPILETALVQASLSSITKLDSNGKPSDELRAEAYIYSLALLPLIDNANREGAVIIKSNMGIDGPALPAGAAAVASAYARSLNGLGVDCKEVGSSDEINSCTGVVSKSNSAGIIAGIIIGAVALIFPVFLCSRRRRKVKKKKDEEKVEFVPPKGELNHDSDLGSPRRPDAETDFLTGNDADAAMADDENYDDYDDDFDDQAVIDDQPENSNCSPEPSDNSEIV